MSRYLCLCLISIGILTAFPLAAQQSSPPPPPPPPVRDRCSPDTPAKDEALRILRQTLDVFRPGGDAGIFNGKKIAVRIDPTTNSLCRGQEGDLITVLIDDRVVFSKADGLITDDDARAFLRAVNADNTTRLQNSAQPAAQDVLRITSQQVSGLVAGRIGAVLGHRPMGLKPIVRPAPVPSAPGPAPEPHGQPRPGVPGDGAANSRSGSLEELASLGLAVLGRAGTGGRGSGGLADRLPGLSLGRDGAALAFSSGGLSGGDQADTLGVWANVSYTRIRNTLSSTDLRGPLYTVIGGADYRLAEHFLFGTALSFELVDVETKFNDGNYGSRGVSVTPYAAYTLPHDWLGLDGDLEIDGLFSYGRLTNETERSRASGVITGHFDGDRLIAATNANYTQSFDRLNLTGQLGYQWARQSSAALTESDGTSVARSVAVLGQFRAGARAGYSWDAFEPYTGATYIYDLTHQRVTVGPDQPQPTDDRDEIEGTLGLNWTPTDTLTGTLEVSHGFFRTDNQNTTVSLSVRGEF